MNTFRLKMRAASITTLLVLITIAQAPADEKANQTQAVADAKPVTFFELYCGNCSRSMRYRATFGSLDEVNVAARIAGEEWKRTAIKSTDLTDGYRGKYTKSQTVSYRVFVGFRRRCSVRWELRSEHRSYREADEVVKALSESSSGPLQIVPHYSQDSETVAKR
jgi:hypothetical protein